MIPIFAIAWNTFQEALRNKVFYISFAVFGVLLFLIPMLPSLKEPDSKLILVNTTCFHLCYYFSLIIVIFTSANLLPDDIQSKRIYTILTKPVSRIKYIAGKVIGILILTYTLMTSMALILIFFIYFTHQQMSVEDQEKSKGYFNTINSYEPSEINYFLRGRKLLGDYACDEIRIRYEGVEAKNFSNKFSAKMLLNFSTFDHDDHLHANVYVFNSTEQKTEILKNVKFKNLKLSSIDIPESIITTSEKVVLEIKIVFAKENMNRVSTYFCKSNMLLLHKKDGSFSLNVLNLFWSSAIQVFSFGVLCFAASAQISYFVSILLTICFFVSGNFSAFFLDHLDQIARKEALLRLSGKVVEDSFLNSFFNSYLGFACRISPHVDKYNHLESYLQNISIHFSSVVDIILYFLLYAGIYSVIGYVLLRKKEF